MTKPYKCTISAMVTKTQGDRRKAEIYFIVVETQNIVLMKSCWVWLFCSNCDLYNYTLRLEASLSACSLVFTINVCKMWTIIYHTDRQTHSSNFKGKAHSKIRNYGCHCFYSLTLFSIKVKKAFWFVFAIALLLTVWSFCFK